MKQLFYGTEPDGGKEGGSAPRHDAVREPFTAAKNAARRRYDQRRPRTTNSVPAQVRIIAAFPKKVYCTKTIISVAIIEGVTFFAVIVYLVVQFTFSICVAIAMRAVLALQFPTRNGVMDWIETQLHRIREEKSFGARQRDSM